MVNKTGQEKKIFVGMELYSEKGELKECTTVEDASVETKIDLKIDSVRGLNKNYLKFFIWDNRSNFKPIVNVKHLGQRPASVKE